MNPNIDIPFERRRCTPQSRAKRQAPVHRFSGGARYGQAIVAAGSR